MTPVPGKQYEFVLTWCPEGGETTEIPLETPVKVAGVNGKFRLITKEVDDRIQEVITQATANPGKTFEVEQ